MVESNVPEDEANPDILIVGGGLGGCAAALGALSLGCRVVMSEETDWIGGQLTAQAVPPDEHAAIEAFGCTRRYRALREGIRAYYRAHYPLSAAARQSAALNPGDGFVSAISHEPRVALAVLEQMLAPWRSSGRLAIRLQTKPVAVDSTGDFVRAVTLRHLPTGREERIAASFVLDATELGDLLPLGGIEYVSGAESRRETGEEHAEDGPPRPDNVQAFTWCFPVAFDPRAGADHTIPRPVQYAFWRDYVPSLTPAWPGRLLALAYSSPRSLAPVTMPLFPEAGREGRFSLWRYRRIFSAANFDYPQPAQDVSLVNWPQNDYMEGNVIDKPEAEVARHLAAARQLSLSLLYWLQTEAPRPDGGTGHPGLRLRPDVVGTSDGLAKAPYFRESRRIKAVHTITETYLRTGDQASSLAEPLHDSVGVGAYNMDLHPTCGGDNYVDHLAKRFQIPLGALIPQRVRNLLPACKNIGTTHLSNGCYRLHPVEWNIGEAAGLLAGYCLLGKTEPEAVRETPERLAEFQFLLVKEGVELAWPQTPSA